MSVVTTATRPPTASVLPGMSPEVRPHGLTTRFLDFWLLGGASLLLWLVMIGAQGFRTSWAVDQHFKNLTYTAASLSLLVNYPHFLVSYHLAYSRGRAFILGNWWQLVVVPLALIGLFAVAFFAYDLPAGRVPLVGDRQPVGFHVAVEVDQAGVEDVDVLDPRRARARGRERLRRVRACGRERKRLLRFGRGFCAALP